MLTTKTAATITTTTTPTTTERRVGERSRFGQRARAVRYLLLAAAVGLGNLACSSHKDEVRPPKPAPEPPLRPRSLVSLLPPVPLRWALHVRPQALLSAPTLASIRETWMGSGRRLAFQHVTGVDLERLPEAWVVSYDLGALYLLPKAGAETAEAAFTHHSQFVIERPSGHSSLRAFVSTERNEPLSLVVSPFFVAFADRDPTLGRLVSLKALGKLDKLPPGLDHGELEALGDKPPEALVSLYWPGALLQGGHLPSPTSSFTDSLLSIKADMSVSEHAVQVRTGLRGAWGDEESAALNVESWFEALLNHPELRSFGEVVRRDGPASCTTEAELNNCQLLMSLDPEALNQALLRLLSGELSAY